MGNHLIKTFRNILVCLFVFLSNLSISEAKEVCKNLSKVNDIDELLFQFYSNIDNQCLFEMPIEELEKIWGIRIINYDANSSSEEKNKSNTEFQRIRDSEEGFFIRKENYEKGIAAFDIHLTIKYINKNHGLGESAWGGSVGKGLFPKLLPSPQIVSDFFRDPYIQVSHISGTEPIIPKNTVYHEHSKYYWLNKAHSDNQPVLFSETTIFRNPIRFTLYSEARILDFK